jgi:hypothetical protein
MGKKIGSVALIATIGMLALMLVPAVSAVRNGDIASIAIGHNAQNLYPLECKGFVQHVVSSAGGNLGAGYTQAYLNAGTEIQASQAMWGDIIQISDSTNPETFYDGMHTAIVLKNNRDSTFKVVDSNWGHDNIVRIDNRNLYNLADSSPRDLQVHFYRLGTTDYWDFNVPGYNQNWEAHNVQSTSVASDGKYRIDPQRNDPWIQLDGLLLNANNYDAIETNLASNAPNSIGQIYFTTSASPGYSEDKRVEFYVAYDGNWKTHTVYMKNHLLWTGTITGIRIDPAALGFKKYNRDKLTFLGLYPIYKL